MNIDFSRDVHAGLSKQDKSIPSKYFYDAQGDELFVQIMALPEYYLTDAEMEIFTSQSSEIIKGFEFDKSEDFDLIELGAGDGRKTQKLLSALQADDYQFEYLPVDISQNALEGLERELEKNMPNLRVSAQQGDYFHILDQLRYDQKPKVVLFLGSNLGNMNDVEAARFIYEIGSNLKPSDKLLLGLDTIKPADIVLPAYDDDSGVTQRFNLNLLRRINRELDANFDLESFEHIARYDPVEGVARSFLRSIVEQQVTIAATGHRYSFSAGELVATEISRKYTNDVLARILENTDFKISNHFTDSRQYFVDYLLTRTG